MVCSGFLGAGKTTTMMALEKECRQRGIGASIISNDLGSRGLADHAYLSALGCSCSQMTGDCICDQRENLVSRLRRLYEEGSQIVFSDIPGFGVGALEHVYHRLAKDYPEEFTLAPFTVVVERASLEKIMGEESASTLPDDLAYILDAQLKEADLILLNKGDLLSDEEREECLAFLSRTWPDTPVLCLSAATGEGASAVMEYLLTHGSQMKKPDLGSGGVAFRKALGKMSESYLQYYARVCCEQMDADAYLCDLAREIRDGLRKPGWDIPHLKLFGRTEDGSFSKVDLLGIGREPVLTHPMGKPCVDLAVQLNASAACPWGEFSRIVNGAIDRVSAAHQLSVVRFYEESFGIMGS
nr:cobalamin synthesis protein, P47K [uncultured bacterium]